MSLTKVSYSMITGAPINVLDYGADSTGVVECSAAIQAAATAASGRLLYFPKGTYLINTAITLLNRTTVYGDGKDSIILLSTGNINGFIATGQEYVVVSNIQVRCTTTGSTSEIAGVKFTSCDKCRAENNFFFGMNWSGVFLDGSSNCTVSGNSFIGAVGTLADSNDIAIYKNSNRNLVEENFCFGAAWHGVFIQNPDVATPNVGTNNIIADNQIAGQSAYGITSYTATQPYNSGTIIRNNVISGITGTQLSGTSGAGIYVAQTGGTLIQGNQISNCCISTTNFGTLAPGCIGVATVAGSFPIVISNNVLSSTRGPCIALVTNEAQIIVESNACFLTNSVASTNSKAIYASNCSYTKITNNTVQQTSTLYYGIEILAGLAYNSTECSITGNTVNANTYGIITSALAGGSIGNLQVIGNVVRGTSLVGLSMGNIVGGQITGNYSNSSGVAYVQENSTKCRLTTNRFVSSSGNFGVIFINTNTGTIVDESNSLEAVINNEAGNGTIIAKYFNSATPWSGNSAVGDRVIQSVPVVGQPKGWRCTVAGDVGTTATFVSEGNL